MFHPIYHRLGKHSLLLVLGVLLGGQPIAALEQDELSGTFLTHTHRNEKEEDEHQGRKGNLMPVMNPTYAKECSGCHFAYQAGLLPARSWEEIMANLKDHFGDNAELAEEELGEIKDYLVNHAADFSPHALSKRIMQSVKGRTFLRITEIPYIAREHKEELSAPMVTQNSQVKSLSYCDKCHTQAAQGSYAEREINIPGYGRVED